MSGTASAKKATTTGSSSKAGAAAATSPATARASKKKHKGDTARPVHRDIPDYSSLPRPHGVFFIDTLAGEEQVDLLYSYPRTPGKGATESELRQSAASHTHALTGLKGVYVASRRIMQSLTGQEVQTVSLGYHPEGVSPLSTSGTHFEHFNPELITIRVGMRVLEDVMFAVVVPTDVAHEMIVRALVHDLLAYIVYLHDDLASIFPERLNTRGQPESHRSDSASESSKQEPVVTNTREARAKLDPIFKRFFKQLFTHGSEMRHNLFSHAFFSGVSYFPLQSPLQFTIQQVIAKLIAGDLRLPAEKISLDPVADIPIGACLYHKGVLVHSELPLTDMIDVTRFVVHNKLFERTPASSQLESWRTVYPTIHDTHSGRRTREPRELSVVAQGWSVLILLTVASSVTRDANSRESSGLPDPHHIEEMKLCLDSLRQAGAFNDIDSELLHAVPPTIDQDNSRLGTALSLHASNTLSNSTITAGTDNVLFHYVAIHHLSGFLLTPCNVPRANYHRPTLLQRFYNTAAAIRTQFRLFLELNNVRLEPPHLDKVDPVAERKNAEDTVWEGSVSSAPKSTKGQEMDIHAFQSTTDRSPFAETGAEALTLIHEIGMRLNSNNPNEDGFWVVGRLYAPDREFYVCYHGSIPQSVTEMAFKLNFGTLV